jgi:phage portal protein BeeE
MIGADDGGTMTYSNVESQMLSFAMLSLQPWLRSIEQALSNDGDLFGPNTYAEFLIDGLLRADSSTRADIYTKALNPDSGWMTRAEVRRAGRRRPRLLPPRTWDKDQREVVRRRAPGGVDGGQDQ